MRRNTFMPHGSAGSHSGLWRRLVLLFAGALMLGFLTPLAAQAGTPGRLMVRDLTVNEDVGTASVRVVLAHRLHHWASVRYRTVDGTAVAGEDYQAASGRVGFPQGSRVRYVRVAILDDSADESATETFTVRLFHPHRAWIMDRVGLVTIQDDDETVPAPPSMSVADDQAQEGDALDFAVTLDKPATAAVTFDYATADGTAKAPGDYTAVTNGKGTIAAGSTSTTVSVSTTEDSTYEGTADQPETMTLALSNPVGAVLGHGTATGTIVDDDAKPTMSVKDPLVQEGKDAVFTVTLSRASGLQAKAEWETSDGTAKAPYDYTADHGVVTFQPGQTSATISVRTADDHVYEPGDDETFFVTLSAPHGAVIGTASAGARIIDADHVPAATLTGGSGLEANGVPFVVSLSPRTTQAVTFTWTVHILPGDTAEAADFASLSGTVTVPALRHDATFSVPTVADTVAEGSQTFHVVITNPVPAGSATFADDAALGTILEP